MTGNFTVLLGCVLVISLGRLGSALLESPKVDSDGVNSSWIRSLRVVSPGIG